MSEMVVNFFVQNSIGGLILNCKTLVAHLRPYMQYIATLSTRTKDADACIYLSWVMLSLNHVASEATPHHKADQIIICSSSR